MSYFSGYQVGSFYDELFTENHQPRLPVEPLIRQIESLPPSELRERQAAAEEMLLKLGITFNVYSNPQQQERIFPFDIIPRVIEHRDWLQLQAGLRQRVQALNLFIADIYGKQNIINDGVIPRDLIESADGYQRLAHFIKPARDIWVPITGIDLVRDRDGVLYVLEDNLRCPSGVSYALENRSVMKAIFPRAFRDMGVLPISDYPENLKASLQYLGPQHHDEEPQVVVLTPGPYNSAYFEHAFLAREMGCPLVQGSDLLVQQGAVYMRSTRGLQRVDVIYRRIDDDFLDPMRFRSDSMLGVPGLVDVYQQGGVSLANAIGTGVADDKAVYAYIPEVIKYYLAEEPIIPNVPTYACWREDDRKFVLDHLDELVVKAVNLSGGYGILIGPQATKAQREEFRKKIIANPRTYIAQPTLSLSRVPTLIDQQIEGRHVDFRPYILFGQSVKVMPGGLTRVALKKNSLVVNSSQGGGSKDTWVLSAAGDLH